MVVYLQQVCLQMHWVTISESMVLHLGRVAQEPNWNRKAEPFSRNRKRNQSRRNCFPGTETGTVLSCWTVLKHRNPLLAEEQPEPKTGTDRSVPPLKQYPNRTGASLSWSSTILDRERKLNTNFFPSNFSGTYGISQQNPRISRQKSLVSLVSRDIPNFSAPTPSRGRPPPHRRISGPKRLGLGSLFLPDSKICMDTPQPSFQQGTLHVRTSTIEHLGQHG